MNKKVLIAATIVALFGAVSCNAQEGSVYQKGDNVGDVIESNGETSSSQQQKVYYTVTLSATVDDVEYGLSFGKKETSKYNGYVFNEKTVSDEDGELIYANCCYKIPTESYESFVNDFEKQFKITEKDVEGTNVTEDYESKVARKEVLEASRAAYLKMLDKEGLSVADVIAINTKIEDIDTELQKINNKLNSYDNLIAYTTIYVRYNLKEKVEPFLNGYWEYVGAFFVGLVQVIAYLLPVLVVAGGVFCAIFFPIRAHQKKINKTKKDNKKKSRK